MIGYKSIAEQGHAACKHSGFNPDSCPYPRNSQVAAEWLSGHHKANRGEHWNNLSMRKAKKAKLKFGD